MKLEVKVEAIATRVLLNGKSQGKSNAIQHQQGTTAPGRQHREEMREEAGMHLGLGRTWFNLEPGLSLEISEIEERFIAGEFQSY